MKGAKYLVVVEVCTVADRSDWTELSSLARSYVRVQATRRLAHGHSQPFLPGALVSLTEAPPLLTEAIRSLRVCDVSFPLDCSWTNMEEVDFFMRFYHLCEDVSGVDRLRNCGGSNNGDLPAWCTAANLNTLSLAVDSDDGDVSTFTVTPLPHASLEGQWESLYYGEGEAASILFKRDIVSYVDTAMRFARAGVNPHLISWNRLLLFYGPPGTGKTSLCRALAQKLAIRLSTSGYPRACLLDINAHSLFSRWFSESGKQVLHLFEQIHHIAADTDCLVCCVMDEVESLAAARTSAMKGNEPSDSIRVVNALLTQIDRLQCHENILVLSTSNLTDAIDEALLDRADKRIYVGPPGLDARQAILQTSVQELLEKGLIAHPAAREGADAKIHVDMELGRSANVYFTVRAKGGEGCCEEASNTKVPGACTQKNSNSTATDSSELQNEETQVAVAAVNAVVATVASGDCNVNPAASPSRLGASGHPRPRYMLTALLHHVAEVSEGLNGRTLKKLPFLAYGTCVCGGFGHPNAAAVDLAVFLEALFNVARRATAEVATKQKID